MYIFKGILGLAYPAINLLMVFIQYLIICIDQKLVPENVFGFWLNR